MPEAVAYYTNEKDLAGIEKFILGLSNLFSLILPNTAPVSSRTT